MAIQNDLIIKVSADLKQFEQSFAQLKSQLDNAKKEITSTDQALGVDQVNKAKTAFSSTSKEISRFSKEIKTGIGSIYSEITNLNNIIAGFVGIQVFKSLTRASSEFEQSLIGVSRVAQATNQDVEAVNQAVKDFSSDGLVPVKDSASSFKQLLASGLNLEQTTKLLTALKDAAAFNRQGFLSMGEAITGAAQGIKNGQSILVDNAGITKNLSILEKDYAESIGTTYGKLTDAQRIQARYIGILKEASIFTGDASKLTQNYSGEISKLSASFELLKVKLGDYITQNKFIKDSIGSVAELFRVLSGADEPATKIDSITQRISQLQKKLTENKETRFSIFGFESQAELSAESVKGLNKEIERLKNLLSIEKQTQLFKDVDKGVDEAIKMSKLYSVERKKIESDLNNSIIDDQKKLRSELKSQLNKDIEAVKEKRDQRIALAHGDAKLLLAIEKDYHSEVQKLNKEATKKFKDESKEKEKSLRDQLELAKTISQISSEALKNPLASLFGGTKGQQDIINTLKILNDQMQQTGDILQQANISGKIIELEDLQKRANQQSKIGAGIGIGQKVFEGEAGARSLGAEGGATLIANMLGEGFEQFIPGLGAILERLFAGPEAVSALVTGFTLGIPEIVVNLALAMPAAVEAFAEALPIAVYTLAANMDKVAIALAIGMPKAALSLALAMPAVAVEFLKGLLQAIPNFINELVGQLKKAFSGGVFGGGGGGGIGGAIKSVGRRLGFAEGGQAFVKQVPLGFPSDSFGANLTSGELVVDNSTSEALKQFLKNGGQNGYTENLLGQILLAVTKPIQVSTELTFNNKVFADVIFELNRTNQRLA